MPSVILVGSQWGDEGKGKISDFLSAYAKHIVRAQGGNNAGHTAVVGQEEYKLHLIPVGILHTHTQCYIGAGTVIDPEILLQEINELKKKGFSPEGRLWISPLAHVIFPYHRKLDILLEKKKGTHSVGTTGRGIGPCYADKANRLGIRMEDLIKSHALAKSLKFVLELKNAELVNIYGEEPLSFENIYSQYTTLGEALAPFIKNVEHMINSVMDAKENILFEGAQGTFLDSTFGSYPFTTSSNTTASGICAGSGVGPRSIDHVLGVMKAFTTRVGQGPFPTELKVEEQFPNHVQAREYGTTTGRPRRMGWFDGVLAKTAVKLNSLDSLALTKLDVLDDLDEVKICTHYRVFDKTCEVFPSFNSPETEPIYETLPGWKQSTKEAASEEDLPKNAKYFLRTIEELCSISVSFLSCGPKREQTLVFQNIFKNSGGL